MYSKNNSKLYKYALIIIAIMFTCLLFGCTSKYYSVSKKSFDNILVANNNYSVVVSDGKDYLYDNNKNKICIENGYDNLQMISDSSESKYLYLLASNFDQNGGNILDTSGNIMVASNENMIIFDFEIISKLANADEETYINFIKINYYNQNHNVRSLLYNMDMTPILSDENFMIIPVYENEEKKTLTSFEAIKYSDSEQIEFIKVLDENNQELYQINFDDNYIFEDITYLDTFLGVKYFYNGVEYIDIVTPKIVVNKVDSIKAIFSDNINNKINAVVATDKENKDILVTNDNRISLSQVVSINSNCDYIICRNQDSNLEAISSSNGKVIVSSIYSYDNNNFVVRNVTDNTDTYYSLKGDNLFINDYTNYSVTKRNIIRDNEDIYQVFSIVDLFGDDDKITIYKNGENKCVLEGDYRIINSDDKILLIEKWGQSVKTETISYNYYTSEKVVIEINQFGQKVSLYEYQVDDNNSAIIKEEDELIYFVGDDINCSVLPYDSEDYNGYIKGDGLEMNRETLNWEYNDNILISREIISFNFNVYKRKLNVFESVGDNLIYDYTYNNKTIYAYYVLENDGSLSEIYIGDTRENIKTLVKPGLKKLMLISSVIDYSLIGSNYHTYNSYLCNVNFDENEKIQLEKTEFANLSNGVFMGDYLVFRNVFNDLNTVVDYQKNELLTNQYEVSEIKGNLALIKKGSRSYGVYNLDTKKVIEKPVLGNVMLLDDQYYIKYKIYKNEYVGVLCNGKGKKVIDNVYDYYPTQVSFDEKCNCFAFCIGNQYKLFIIK
ncbi:MAG: hypothetical protein WCR54_02945 [Clostridia bacterium]